MLCGVWAGLRSMRRPDGNKHTHTHTTTHAYPASGVCLVLMVCTKLNYYTSIYTKLTGVWYAGKSASRSLSRFLSFCLSLLLSLILSVRVMCVIVRV